jgi:hypothetical protein
LTDDEVRHFWSPSSAAFTHTHTRTHTPENEVQLRFSGLEKLATLVPLLAVLPFRFLPGKFAKNFRRGMGILICPANLKGEF